MRAEVVVFNDPQGPTVTIPVSKDVGEMGKDKVYELTANAIENLCGTFELGPTCETCHERQLRFSNGVLACATFMGDPAGRVDVVMVIVFQGPPPVDSLLTLMLMNSNASPKERMH